MGISLIANSGIQFHKLDLSVKVNASFLPPMGFYEFPDAKNERISLQYAYFLPDSDIWVPKSILKNEDNLDENDSIKDNINFNVVKNFALREETEYYTISDIGDCLELFASGENTVWLPVPYFKKNNNQQTAFGPTGWARMMIRKQPAPDKKTVNYKVVLLFDTKLSDEGNTRYAPGTVDTSDEENLFALCTNEDYLLNFCDREFQCDWVERYIRKIVQQGKEPKDFPFLKHIAYYIYFIRYLGKSGFFPEVRLFSDQKKPIDVDLVLDIGNSNTCGLLFESSADNKSFNFNAVKKLKLFDVSDPEQEYDEPFSMRLAFVEPRFGEIVIPGYKNFRWPSLVRLGKEAARFINTYNLDEEKGRETNCHHSSPKRYLWDTSSTEIPWEFVNFRGSNVSESIYYEGISEQFKENGDYAYDGNFACLPTYSRKSLMTFVYIEILLHAISQINSHEFRYKHGNAERPRRLRRITITCPTSIIQKEQVVLRECAAEAARTLSRFFSGQFIGEYDVTEEKSDLEIVPKPKDLAKKLSELSFRRDWIYDEATCSQLVFLYAEISQRYLNKADVFFNLYGRRRSDVTYPEEKSLTIASIDIGGGTTDLMISAYQYEKGQSLAVIKPHPLFWESFNLAGDDLLKEIIQQIIIEGSLANLEDAGAIGVIENAARSIGITDVSARLNNFFGPDNNKQDYTHRILRKNFIIQVAIPIAIRYLSHAISSKPDEYITFDDFFPENKPNQKVIDYFHNHFKPLKLESIKWKLSARRVNTVIENTFEPLFKQLSAIISSYGCDFLLLAGRPTTIPKIRELFIKYYPVSPERLITLNNYRVGQWYPFSDDIGYFSDAKTIVSVGALIALMGGTIDKLEGFRLNTQLLRKSLISTSDYMGLMNVHTQNLDTVFVTPDENSCEIEVHSLPMMIGYKQLPNPSYRARAIYKLDFNENYFRQRVLEQNPSLKMEKDISLAVENFRTNLKGRMPFRIKLKRDWTNSHEILTVEGLTDSNKNESSKQVLSLHYMTLTQEKGYWLDTGEFILNIR